MAATRVSLSMDESVLERARHHSEVRKVSISKLFVSMVCMLDEAESRQRELPPITRQLKGLLKPKSHTHSYVTSLLKASPSCLSAPKSKLKKPSRRKLSVAACTT